MAKITVAGEAVVITSAIKLEDYEKVGRADPDGRRGRQGAHLPRRGLPVR